MPTRNDITKDELRSKVPSKQYKDNWDRIFGDKHAKQRELQTGLQDRVQEAGCVEESEDATGC